MSFFYRKIPVLFCLIVFGWLNEVNAKRPNIVILMSDDQDLLLGEFDS